MCDYQFHKDIYGIAALDCHQRKSDDKIVIEREDGILSDDDIYHYFPQDSLKSLYYQEGLKKYIHGPVLDLGCGPGRFIYYLWKEDISVVGIDISRNVLKICSEFTSWEIPVAQMSLSELGFVREHFRTILLMGNNIGSVGDLLGLRELFKNLYEFCRYDATILLTSIDVALIPDVKYRTYFFENKPINREFGQERIRLRYKDIFGKYC